MNFRKAVDSSYMDDAIPRSLLLLFFIVAGGFFSGAETAYSYTNVVRVRMLAENKDRRARRAVRILDNFDKLIVTLLIMINVVHIAASAVATAWMIDLTGSAAIGSVLATIIMTLAIFIFSETLPKNFAKTNCDAYALASSLLIGVLMTVLTPVSFLLTLLGTGVKKLFRLAETEPSITEDEFATMVEDAADDDVFEPEESEIIKSAIEFGDTTAEEIMVPKTQIVAISVKADPEEVKETLIEEKYSRIPVYRGSVNNNVGIVRTA
jgi:Mg2+/Co2+ transporter CorB